MVEEIFSSFYFPLYHPCKSCQFATRPRESQGLHCTIALTVPSSPKGDWAKRQKKGRPITGGLFCAGCPASFGFQLGKAQDLLILGQGPGDDDRHPVALIQ